MELMTKPEISPICPHCNQALRVVFQQEIHATLGKRYIYFCPHCHKVLGVSQRKGFWMG